ncbi:hypothetical protein [Pseudomonas sp. IT-P4]|uniref:hypothetical protein n=1 Tax=Pseudomonas sp. IT-P4 TaxID=3026446 RepID=UPI0039DF5704
MTQANIPHNLLAFWVSGSLYAAASPAEALNLAKESDRTTNHLLENVRTATPEDLAEVVPWGDQFVTLGEWLNARTEAGCMVRGE